MMSIEDDIKQIKKDLKEIKQRLLMEGNVPDTENTFLTTKELAKRWGMSVRTLDNSRQKSYAKSQYKNLKYMKLGRNVSYRLSDVIAFENSREFKLGGVSVGNEEDDS